MRESEIDEPSASSREPTERMAFAGQLVTPAKGGGPGAGRTMCVAPCSSQGQAWVPAFASLSRA